MSVAAASASEAVGQKWRFQVLDCIPAAFIKVITDSLQHGGANPSGEEQKVDFPRAAELLGLPKATCELSAFEGTSMWNVVAGVYLHCNKDTPDAQKLQKINPFLQELSQGMVEMAGQWARQARKASIMLSRDQLDWILIEEDHVLRLSVEKQAFEPGYEEDFADGMFYARIRLSVADRHEASSMYFLIEDAEKTSPGVKDQVTGCYVLADHPVFKVERFHNYTDRVAAFMMGLHWRSFKATNRNLSKDLVWRIMFLSMEDVKPTQLRDFFEDMGIATCPSNFSC